MLRKAKRVVVKVGSQLLAGEDGLNREFIDSLTRQIASLRGKGVEVVLVSSGAVLAGIKALKLRRKPFSLSEKQALSAVGQPYLMAEYRESFKRFNLKVGQVLLTAEDLRSKERFHNAKNTFNALFKLGVIPVVNENDTLSTEEIRIGDNDNLSAHVSVLVDADLLVILTTSPGVFDKNPENNPDAKLIPVIEDVREILESCDFSTQTRFGTGGMATKIEAAAKAAKKGIPVIIAGGREERVLERILNGERLGTLVMPCKKLKAKGYRILYLMKPKGKLFIDQGAEEALVKGEKSLLSRGVKRCEGEFKKGDAVEVFSLNGKLVGKGIVRCSKEELSTSKLCIHRDDFVLLREDI
ncbi:glutamate 5-kinase [Thermovibrio guaymasensis]|uniref:Glutamate 5-kinase n=1 Tax=Thermovibrio guaymasensis TaxID=240167 RepID=A0A420W6D6_9BACT|nr:glutamate 5-kinase [Thermovibrio guaymasensis]RKQ61636.1 glutamate 5-kinase [Thermovibrio guaymasensis]